MATNHPTRPAAAGLEARLQSAFDVFMARTLQRVELHIPRDAESSELLHTLALLLQRYEVTNGHATVVLSGERLSLARSIVAALSERDSPRR